MTWRIDRLVPGGDGFSKLPDGRAAFAPGALPGDLIEPTEIEDHRSYVRTHAWKLIEPGAERVEPPCPVADACGGCDLMRLARPAQLQQKAGILREALARTGGFHDLPDPLPMVDAGPALGYRSRIRVHIDEDGRVGFFSGGTHDLVEVPGCVIAEPTLDDALRALRALAAAQPAQAATYAEAEIRVAPAGPPVSVHLSARDGEGDRAFADAVAARFGAGDEQRFPLAGDVELYAPPDVFTQVNWSVNRRMILDLIAGARARDVATFCDLYAGAGNFTLPLLAAGLSGVGIERSRSAINAAKRAAAARQLEARFIAGEVAPRLLELAKRDERFDLVLLDPPRAGAREALRGVIALTPRVVAYCACDPVTLARDLRALAASGYALESVTGYDMFPQTHHVEALAWMWRATT